VSSGHGTAIEEDREWGLEMRQCVGEWEELWGMALGLGIMTIELECVQGGDGVGEEDDNWWGWSGTGNLMWGRDHTVICTLGHPHHLLQQSHLAWPCMEVCRLGMEVWKVEGPAHEETKEPQPTGSMVVWNRSGQGSLK
jgi:hypothetical protein